MPGVCPATTSATTVRTAKDSRLQLPGSSGAVNRPATSAAANESIRKAPTRVLKAASEPGPVGGQPQGGAPRRAPERVGTRP